MYDRSRISPVTYGLAFYLILSALDALSIVYFASVSKILALVPLVLLIFSLKELRLRFHSLFFIQIAFWFLAMVSLFYTVAFDRSILACITLTLNLTMVVVFGVMVPYNQRELDLIQKAVLWGCWLQILLTFVFADISAAGRLTMNIGGSTQDQNNNNTFFLYAFSYHCYRLLSGRQKKQVIPVLMMLTLVLFSGSRGALVAFAMTFFFHICLMFGKSKHALRKIFLVVIIIAITAWFFNAILKVIPESVAVRFSWEYLEEKGTTGRGQTWLYLWELFRDSDLLRMLFGYGYGSTPVVNEFNYHAAHNTYIDNLIAVGVLGAGLHIAGQGAVLHAFRKNKKYELMGAYIGMIVMCISLSLMACKPLWNMVLIALAIDCNRSETNPSN